MDILLEPTFWLQYIGRSLFLLFLGLAFLSLKRVGFTNLGISAQLIGSAIGGCLLANATGNSLFTIFGCFMFAFLILLVPILLKHFLIVDEILTTLFFSFMTIPIAQFIMQPKGDSMIVATPFIPEKLRFESLVIGQSFGNYLSLIHFSSIICVIFAYLYFEKSVMGHQSKIIEFNVNSVRDSWLRLKLLSVAGLYSSAFITLAVIADTFIRKSRYTQGDYDIVGFLGVVIGLMALRRFELLLFMALIVAFLETIFLTISIYGVPEMVSKIIYGAGILATAFLMKKKYKV